MVVFSNRRLGPGAELIVSRTVAGAMLEELASAARASLASRWEHELVAWLGDLIGGELSVLDVEDIAWTPEHFELQRELLVEALDRAARGSRHERALRSWSRMIAEHPREAIRVGRRWLIPGATARDSERLRDNDRDAGDSTGGSEASGRVRADDLSLGR